MSLTTKIDVQIGKFKARDGLSLHFEHWSPPDFRATILFVHGMGDHCGRYGPFVHYFTQRNFKVCLFDQRGHGKSQGKRVFVKEFDTLLTDLEDYLQFSLNGGATQPLFLVGHSFGGQISLNFLGRHPARFQAACVVSPSLEIALTMPKWLERLGRMVLPLWPGMKLKNLTNPDLLSHDPQVAQAYKKDSFVSDYVTIGIGKQMINNLATIYGLTTQIKTPLLMLHGTEDRYCSVEGTKRFYKELRLDQKRLKLYEGKYHELLNEVEKENVFQEMENWFSAFMSR